jgi:Ankyrin repeats (many copies)
MEDIARALRHAEMEKDLHGRQDSSPAAKVIKAGLLLVVVAAAGLLVFVSTPYGRDGPLREALVKVPGLDKIIVSSTALFMNAPASDELAGSEGHANGSHPHRLGGHQQQVPPSRGFSQDVQCEMNGKGECIMVASSTPVQLTEEEVAALMEDEKNSTTRSVDASSSSTSAATTTTSTNADSAKSHEESASTSSISMSPLELRRAAAVGDESAVAECLSAHPDWVDEPDRNHWTPLHLAVRAGHLPVVRVLLKFGANVRAKTVSGESPMDMAAARLGSDHPVTQLLQSHAIWLLSKNKASSTSSRSQ